MNGEQTFQQFLTNQSVQIDVPSFAMNLLLAAFLGFLLSRAYERFGDSLSNRRLFARNFVLLAVTTMLIISIVKSSLALSLGLVGALSIVRFRTPVKDARDLVFVFAAIAIGMACGTQFHVFAAIFTAFVAGLVLVFYYWGFGDLPNKGYVVKMRINGSDKDRVAELCGQLCKRFSVVSITRSNGDDVEDVIYEVELKRGVAYKDLLERLTKAIQPESVNVLVGEGNVNA